MGEKAKAAFSGAVPRWFSAISMSVCALLLYRVLDQHDMNTRDIGSIRESVAITRAETARLAAEMIRTSDVVLKMDDLLRALEKRQDSLERKARF